MRMPALILTVLAAALLLAPASPQDNVNPSRKERKEESAKKVKELQKERIATLEEMKNLISVLSKVRLAPHEEVFETRLLLLKAELDAAEKESDRITLYKNTVEVLKEYEQWTADMVKQARGTAYPVLKIKTRRLEVEIDLEREKAKEEKKAE
jgi:hypothetical protein